MNDYAKLIALHSEILDKDEKDIQDLDSQIKDKENKKESLVDKKKSLEEKKRCICFKIDVFKNYPMIVKTIKKEIINKRIKKFFKKEKYSLVISLVVSMLLSPLFNSTVGISAFLLGMLSSTCLFGLSEGVKAFREYNEATLKYQEVINNYREEALVEDLQAILESINGISNDIKEIEVEIQNISNQKAKQEVSTDEIRNKICFVIEKLESAIGSPEVEATLNTLYAKDKSILNLAISSKN